MDKILGPLNAMQREAVLFTDGALLVLAGAGSGKTRVITHRFAYLLKKKRLYLQNILAVTFTNKAAGEMKERIGLLTGMDTRNAWVRTFHSMGVLILRKNPEAIGYPKEFVIYDDTDSKNLVKTIMKDLNINTESFNPAGVGEKISSLKDTLVSPEEFERMRTSYFDDQVSKVFHEYQRMLRKNKAVDFADLIALPIQVFSNYPEILGYYENIWRYVMVDEFQDTNSAQYKLINLICGRNKNVCVVGDDDQSIYGWRGAVVDNIYDFQSRYNAKVIPLEQNYRSTDVILEAANSVVRKIGGRMEKKLWTERKSTEKIHMIEAFTDKEESAIIVETVDKLLAHYNYRDFAVFYRTNAQSRLFEEELLSRNIPYKIFGGQKFYERKEIKDILSYIRLIINPFDGGAFDRIINVPRRKIGDTSRERIKSFADRQNTTYIEAMMQPDKIPGLNKNTAEVVRELGQVLLELNQEMDRITPTNFVKILLDAIGYQNYITVFDEDGLDRWSNVEELINSIRDFENANPDSFIADFISEVTLQTSVDTMEEDSGRNYVSLMTIHNAKGLEFPVVFVSGVVNGLIPHIQASYSDKELDEERRLFYVAITRAKDRLYLSYPETRMKYGELMECMPSSFLKDIPEQYCDNPYSRRERAVPGAYGAGFFSKENRRQNSSSFSGKKRKGPVDDMETFGNNADLSGEKGVDVSSILELKVGDSIIHKRFGRGKVTFVSENFVKINFDKYGVQNMSGNFLSSLSVIRP